MDIYDIIFIGSGPGVVLGVLDQDYKLSKQKCLIIEKGKSIDARSSDEVLYGFGGAGTFSDGKLVANPYVGGDIRDLMEISDDQFYDIADTILMRFKYFYDGSKNIAFKWMKEDVYEVPSDILYLLKSKVCHIGTETSQGIFLNMQKYIQEEICPIYFEEEVTDIFKQYDGFFEIRTNKNIYKSKKVVIGIGKRGNLVQKLIKNFNLEYKNNKVQIGVRVEAPNIYLNELVEKFYDYKVVMNCNKGRVRSFCACGSLEKAAEVAVEKGEDFYSVNGHSFRDKGSNGLINFGIVCSLDLGLNKEEQIKLMQKVNGVHFGNKILAQNIDDFIEGRTTKELNYATSMKKEDYRLDNLWNNYPQEICDELRKYLLEFKKVYQLDGHFFAPEIKLVNPLIKMENPFEVKEGLFLVGDCSGYARSIIQSGLTGIVVCERLVDD